MFDQPTRRGGSAARARLSQLAAQARTARGGLESDRTPLGDGVEVLGVGGVGEVGERPLTHDTDPQSGTRHSQAGPVRSLFVARTGRLIERWIPESLARSGHSGQPRWRPLAITAGLAAVIALVAVVSVLFSGTPAAEHPPPLPIAEAKAGSPGAVPVPAQPKPGKPEHVVVSVVGKVATPGLVTVPAGARVADAVRVAGGSVDDVDVNMVNLARRLVDGEQLYVGVAVPQPASQPAGPVADASPASPETPAVSAGAPSVADGKVDLNSAGAEQLNSIDGVGEVTAQRILEWRTQHGRFGSVEQLREVDGIGEKRFSQMREHVGAS